MQFFLLFSILSSNSVSETSLTWLDSNKSLQIRHKTNEIFAMGSEYTLQRISDSETMVGRLEDVSRGEFDMKHVIKRIRLSKDQSRVIVLRFGGEIQLLDAKSL